MTFGQAEATSAARADVPRQAASTFAGAGAVHARALDAERL
jgi:hypothetical protein